MMKRISEEGFGDCEVMVKDISDSRRIDSLIRKKSQSSVTSTLLSFILRINGSL